MSFLYLLSHFRTPVGDAAFQLITYLGQELFIVAVICWLFWCADKKLACSLGFAYFLSGLLIQGLKITFRIPRPWILDPGFSPVSSALSGATGYSFPSGHTQSVTAMFGTFALHAKKSRSKILCFTVIGAVMLSRMYLGVHTPADVGVSFLLSMGCVLLNYFYIYKKDFSQTSIRTFFPLLILAAAGLGVYALILENNAAIELKYAQDCLKASGAGIAFCLGFLAENRWIRFSAPSDLGSAVIRFALGIAGAVLILKVPALLAGSTLFINFLRYFLTVLWITAAYPWLFTRYFQKRRPSDA